MDTPQLESDLKKELIAKLSGRLDLIGKRNDLQRLGLSDAAIACQILPPDLFCRVNNFICRHESDPLEQRGPPHTGGPPMPPHKLVTWANILDDSMGTLAIDFKSLVRRELVLLATDYRKNTNLSDEMKALLRKQIDLHGALINGAESSDAAIASKMLGPSELNDGSDLFKLTINSLWIKSSPIHMKKALEDWSAEATAEGDRVEKLELRAASLKNEIYQVVGFYLVFEGLMMTAVAQSSLLHVNNVKACFALSLAAVLVFFLAAFQKSHDLSLLLKSRDDCLWRFQVAATKVKALRKSGPEFLFSKFKVESSRHRSWRLWTSWKRWTFWKTLLISLSLISISALILNSQWRILTDFKAQVAS